MAAPGKQYGLILSQKKVGTKTVALQRTSVFGDDSDDETPVGESLQKEAVKKRMMKQTRIEMQKALEEDSTVYDYDGVYDDIQNKRLETSKKLQGGAERKPKYINQLMKAVEDRKKEQDRRDERKIQKEREAEGQEFADKEAYVTSAYRQKLKERQEELEKEQREAAMEAALDVKKQKDLSGFYRHLLNQTVGEEAIPDPTTDRKPCSVPPTAPDMTSAAPLSPSGDTANSFHSDSEDGQESKPGFSKPSNSSGLAKRQYRQRSVSPGSGNERGRDKVKDRDGDKVKERDRHKKSQRDKDRRKERDGERDDRHGGRRDDKDRRKDRGGERERESEPHRSREERDRHKERQERREKSPKERRRDDDNDEKNKGKKGSPQEQEEKERMKDTEKERAMKPEATDKEGGQVEKQEGAQVEKQEGGQVEKQEGAQVEKPEGGGGGSPGEERANKFAKRSSDHTVSSARDRYLARQMARSASKAYIEKEED
ncbi:hypothetical protein NHX12_009841 [Muraenolepis orangiensis]|uniref:Nuclear speckle splicing regulatory protein 1 n=1 Tax=Muraenolepis orangiensis TaxID=630683 RepID=A0A9Q0DJZ6_9TELE|nr:hypothetical protein NHX12_009841 [Muraenolepis orangiensis]